MRDADEKGVEVGSIGIDRHNKLYHLDSANITLRMREKTTKKPATPEAESFGTVAGEAVRAKANTFSDTKREQLMAAGMAIIYGNSGRSKVAANNR